MSLCRQPFRAKQCYKWTGILDIFDGLTFAVFLSSGNGGGQGVWCIGELTSWRYISGKEEFRTI